MEASRDKYTLKAIEELESVAEAAFQAGAISKKELQEVTTTTENPETPHWKFVAMKGEIIYKHGLLIRGAQPARKCNNTYDSPQELELYKATLEEAYTEGAIDYRLYKVFQDRLYDLKVPIGMGSEVAHLRALIGESILNRERMKENPYVFVRRHQYYDVRHLLLLLDEVNVEQIVAVMDTLAIEAVGRLPEDEELGGGEKERLHVLYQIRNAFMRFGGIFEMVDWLQDRDEKSNEKNLESRANGFWSRAC